MFQKTKLNSLLDANLIDNKFKGFFLLSSMSNIYEDSSISMSKYKKIFKRLSNIDSRNDIYTLDNEFTSIFTKYKWDKDK